MDSQSIVNECVRQGFVRICKAIFITLILVALAMIIGFILLTPKDPGIHTMKSLLDEQKKIKAEVQKLQKDTEDLRVQLLKEREVLNKK